MDWRWVKCWASGICNFTPGWRFDYSWPQPDLGFTGGYMRTFTRRACPRSVRNASARETRRITSEGAHQCHALHAFLRGSAVVACGSIGL